MRTNIDEQMNRWIDGLKRNPEQVAAEAAMFQYHATTRIIELLEEISAKLTLINKK